MTDGHAAAGATASSVKISLTLPHSLTLNLNLDNNKPKAPDAAHKSGSICVVSMWMHALHPQPHDLTCVW